jgi:hypothetical protein
MRDRIFMDAARRIPLGTKSFSAAIINSDAYPPEYERMVDELASERGEIFYHDPCRMAELRRQIEAMLPREGRLLFDELMEQEEHRLWTHQETAFDLGRAVKERELTEAGRDRWMDEPAEGGNR